MKKTTEVLKGVVLHDLQKGELKLTPRVVRGPQEESSGRRNLFFLELPRRLLFSGCWPLP